MDPRNAYFLFNRFSFRFICQTATHGEKGALVCIRNYVGNIRSVTVVVDFYNCGYSH